MGQYYAIVKFLFKIIVFKNEKGADRMPAPFDYSISSSDRNTFWF